MCRVLRMAVTLLIVVLIIPACGKSTEENFEQLKPKKQTVTLYMPQGRHLDVYKEFQKKLEAEDNIVLNYIVLREDQYYKLAQTKLATREVPDIILHNAPQRYTEYNVQMNMVDLSNEPWVARLVNPNLLRDEHGRIYAMPLESSTFYAAAYYNKKVFADLELSEPKTYADFLRILETIKTKGNGITTLFMSNKDTWTTQIFITAGLPVLLGDRAKETWEKIMTNKIKWTEIPEYKTILTQYQDLYKKGYINQDHEVKTFADAKGALAAGKAAIVFNGEWTASDLITKYNMDPDDIGAFVLPFGNRDIMATGEYVTGFYIPK